MSKKALPSVQRGTLAALTVGVSTALILGTALGNWGGNLMPVLLAGANHKFGLSTSMAGVVATVQLMSTAIATLACAARAAKPGRARMARIGVVVATVGLLLAGFAPTVWLLVIANAVAGAGFGVIFAAACAAIAATVDSEKASSVSVFGSTVIIAVLLFTLPLSEALLGAGGPFLVLAVCTLVCFWPLGRLPEAPEPARLTDSGARVGSAKPSLIFLAGALLVGICDQGAWSFTEILGTTHAHLGEDIVSLVLSLSALASLGGIVASALLAKRWGIVPTLVGLFVVEIVAKFCTTYATGGTLFIVGTIVWQVCYLGLLAELLAVAALVDRSGVWVAAAGGALSVGTGVGPIIMGWVLEHAGATAFGTLICLGTALAGVGLIGVSRRELRAAGATRLRPTPTPQPERHA